MKFFGILKSKKVLSLLSAAAIVGGVSLATAQPAEAGIYHNDKINAHQANQRQRIFQGVRSGQLDRNEARHLIGQQRQINRMEHRFATNDGRLSRGERYRLGMMQDRASYNIFNQKHDRQHRYYR